LECELNNSSTASLRLTVFPADYQYPHCNPANCPGMSGTVLDLLLLSPVPHGRGYLLRMSREIWSPTTQTFSDTGTIASYMVRQLIFVVNSTHYRNHDF